MAFYIVHFSADPIGHMPEFLELLSLNLRSSIWPFTISKLTVLSEARFSRTAIYNSAINFS